MESYLHFTNSHCESCLLGTIVCTRDNRSSVSKCGCTEVSSTFCNLMTKDLKTLERRWQMLMNHSFILWIITNNLLEGLSESSSICGSKGIVCFRWKWCLCIKPKRGEGRRWEPVVRERQWLISGLREVKGDHQIVQVGEGEGGVEVETTGWEYEQSETHPTPGCQSSACACVYLSNSPSLLLPPHWVNRPFILHPSSVNQSPVSPFPLLCTLPILPSLLVDEEFKNK